MPSVRRSVATALVSALAACTTTDPTIFDPFDIPVNLDAGVILIGARSTDIDTTVHTAVVDTAAPITVFDVGTAGTSRRRAVVQLIGAGTGVPRAQFDAVAALLAGTGNVGEDRVTPVSAVIGADLLVLHALEIDASKGTLRIFPDVAGDDKTLALSCQSSFSTPLGGGGSFQIGNDTVRYPATRIVFAACLEPAPVDCIRSSTTPCGQDTLLLLSTAVWPMVLSRSTYRQLTLATEDAVDALPVTSLHVPGTSRPTLTGRKAIIHGLAIADRGNHGDDNPPRGACLEFRISRYLTDSVTGACPPDSEKVVGDAPPVCPCLNGQVKCQVGPAVETGRDLEAVVIPDTDPFLASFRDELRPAVGDLSGLIGVQALTGLVVDVDYPHGRTIIACSGADSTCVRRPAVIGTNSEELSSFQSDLAAASCIPGATTKPASGAPGRSR